MRDCAADRWTVGPSKLLRRMPACPRDEVDMRLDGVAVSKSSHPNLMTSSTTMEICVVAKVNAV